MIMGERVFEVSTTFGTEVSVGMEASLGNQLVFFFGRLGHPKSQNRMQKKYHCNWKHPKLGDDFFHHPSGQIYPTSLVGGFSPTPLKNMLCSSNWVHLPQGSG